MDSKSLSPRWKCQYHIVFIPKYRKKKLFGQLKLDVREILATLCKYKGVEIIEGAVCTDHVHMCVSIPPKISVSNFMGYLKGKSTLMIYDRHPEQQSKWNKAFWARGYYVATVGNVTEDAIKKYIREQSEESRKEESEGAAFQRPPVNPDAAAVTMVWGYIGELVFNMLVLVGAVKMADRVVREMMGLQTFCILLT